MPLTDTAVRQAKPKEKDHYSIHCPAALRQPVVTGAIVGARRPAQVDGLIAALELRFSAAEIDEIWPFLPVSMGTNFPGVA